MPRYLRQPDKYGCGPIAIMNALKWAGARVTLANYKLFRTATCCVSPDGTDPKSVYTALRLFEENFTIRKLRKIAIRAITGHLRAGGTAIVSFGFDDDSDSAHNRAGHFYFLISVSNTGKQFIGINYWPSRKRTVSRLSRKTLINDFRKRKCICGKCSGWPTVWLLTRRNAR